MAKHTDVLLLANAMTGQFISGVATRIFIVSLPTIATALNADILSVSWALIAYQVAGISLSVVFGRLGDIHGRYAIYGAGFVVMTVSSGLCGLAPGVGWLIVFRLVQGVGAAMIASAARVLAMEALPEGAEGRANGFMTMSYHGGLLLGPPLGGLVIDLLSWRWIFFLLVPIGVAGTVLAFATTSSILTFLLPFYIQDVLHRSPSFMGLLFLSAPILTISLAVLAGHLTDRVGPRIPATIGLSVVMASFAIGVGLKVDSHWALPA